MTDFNFEEELIALIPKLRAYAILITRSRDAGDDLVQDTLMRALKSAHTFTPGTNLKAWAFTILRHQYITWGRRKQPGPIPAGANGGDTIAPASQEDTVMLSNLMRVMDKLPAAQREALLMVGGNGCSYEEAAAIMKCSVGTMKSRVSRARSFLQAQFRTDEPADAVDEGAEDSTPAGATEDALPPHGLKMAEGAGAAYCMV